MSTTEMFPQFAQQEAEQQEVDLKVARQRAIQHHRSSMRLCWPQWKGPQVGGQCEVSACIAYSLTHQQGRYHYSAPCIIDSISPDGETFEVTVNYPAGSICSNINGERLRLDITEIWPPVRILAARRARVC